MTKWNDMSLEEKIEDLRGWRTVLAVGVVILAFYIVGVGLRCGGI